MKILLTAFLVAATLGFAQETERQYLSGHGKDDPVSWEFFCTAGQHSNVWTTIPVPSCWEVQGFGAYGYQEDPVKESGKYRHRFAVPAAWKGRVVRIVFEGVMTDTEVRINGQTAGPVHQGGFYRFNHDISRLVNYGAENLLEVTVAKRSANESINAAERTGDYWNFGGIFRPVYLEALPAGFMERTAIDARADGTFGVDVLLGGDIPAGSRVTAQIEGVGEPFAAEVAGGRAMLKTKVSGQKNWTAETPALYRVQLVLTAEGKPVHRITERFGFRTVEVRDGDGVYLNGQRIVLKGACRHSFWPESGRTLSEAINRSDIKLLQEANMNAVRMSHYPPDIDFLDLCDELGLYVLDEVAGWQKCYDTDVGKGFVEAMIQRDVNHPSILFWDNGNEGGWNTELDGEFAKWDPQQRRVLHPWEFHGGVNTKHYADYELHRTLCAGPDIYMPTEFLHGLYDGGAGAGLEDYWALTRASKTAAGGFLWAFLDEGVVRTDQAGRIDAFGNRGPDGIVGPHREKKGSFLTVREIWSPVQVSGEPPALKLANCYDFTNLAECRFAWALGTFAPGRAGHAVVAQGELSGPPVAPHGSGELKLDLPGNWRDAQVLYVTAENPQGRELWTWSWRLKRAESHGQTTDGKVEVSDGPNVTVRTGGLDFVFSRETGLLTRVGRFAFGNGPRFVAGATQQTPAGLDKKQKPKFKASLLDLSGNGKLVSFQSQMEGANAVVRAAYEGPLKEVAWTIQPGGWCQLAYTCALDRECNLAGVNFDYPEERVKSMRWLGAGPYRVWKNRIKGTTWDVWENAVNHNLPGERWDYPEFQGYFGEWQWVEFDTADGTITAVNGEGEAPYLGVYRPTEGRDPAKTQLFTPPTGLAFLDAIPPIGNKFTPPEKVGPQSQPNAAPGICRRTVRLRFVPAP